MEAMRILKAIGVRPRRTIRLALWTGEEQGLYGSRGYVREHLGVFAPPEHPSDPRMPAWMGPQGALSVKPDLAQSGRLLQPGRRRRPHSWRLRGR